MNGTIYVYMCTHWIMINNTPVMELLTTDPLLPTDQTMLLADTAHEGGGIVNRLGLKKYTSMRIKVAMQWLDKHQHDVHVYMYMQVCTLDFNLGGEFHKLKIIIFYSIILWIDMYYVHVHVCTCMSNHTHTHLFLFSLSSSLLVYMSTCASLRADMRTRQV